MDSGGFSGQVWVTGGTADEMLSQWGSQPFIFRNERDLQGPGLLKKPRKWRLLPLHHNIICRVSLFQIYHLLHGQLEISM